MTLENIIAKVIRAISQVPGSGTQLYAEDRIADIIQQTFDLVFSEAWWPQYMQWFTRSLDGSTGLITQTITIAEYRDIRAVFRAGSDDQLSVLNASINPFNLSGTTARYIEGYSETGKPLIVYPTASAGDIVIHGRVKPADFSGSDNINFDHNCLIYGAAWQYLEDDATNPASAAKFQTMFEARLKQLKRDLSNQPLELDPRVTKAVERWTEL